MNLNSLDAAAVTQPGGLYANINDGLLKGLMAYFQHRDREREGERQLRREEHLMSRQQLADALAQARHQQAQEDAALQALVKRMQLVQAGIMPPNPTPTEAAAFSRQASQRALEDRNAGMRSALLGAQVQAARNEAAWNAPFMRGVRGVASWLGDTVQEAVKAQGRRKGELVPGLDSAKVALRDIRAAEAAGTPYYGPNNAVIPNIKLPAYRLALEQWIQQQERGDSPSAPTVPTSVPNRSAGGSQQKVFTKAEVEQAARERDMRPEDIIRMLQLQGHRISN